MAFKFTTKEHKIDGLEDNNLLTSTSYTQKGLLPDAAEQLLFAALYAFETGTNCMPFIKIFTVYLPQKTP